MYNLFPTTIATDMDFSAAASPDSSMSGSDSHSSYSPRLMSQDLGLDPSDPLNLLLHNTSQGSDSSSIEGSSSLSTTPPDWSQLSALWPSGDSDDLGGTGMGKSYPDIMMDFANLSSLNMDFNPSMSIDPNALHFDPMKFSTYDADSHLLSNELLSAHFPFTFQPNLGNDFSQPTRRLSVTSSSSSSGASLSPVMEPMSSPVVSYNDPAAELAQRVRQTAGVMLAVPMGAHIQGNTTPAPHSTHFVCI